MFNFENDLEKTISEEVQMYASKEYSSQIISAMLSKEASSHTSIAVDSMNLFESNIAFAHFIFQNPRRALKLLDDAFQKISLDLSKSHALKAEMVYRENLHVRLIALPNLPEVYRSSLPNCSDVGQFLCISGTIVKASTTKILQYKKLWRCSKCKYQFIVEAGVEQSYVCEKPVICNNPDFCNGKNFTLMNTDTTIEYCKDYQEIKLQEQVYNLSIGTVPRSMWVVLEDDLVETCYPGNDIIVSGILIQRWKPLVKGKLIDIDLVILAHNIEVQNKMTSGVVSKNMIKEFKDFWYNFKSDPLSGRNFILLSICPQVFGLYVIKLAVALVLAGGVQKKSGSSRIRGDSHLLLVGDPGTAKSQFLKFATKVSPRSVLTSGIGTTNAGLTVSAVKESGRWELEAGALVLADGGICCIDEFSCIKEQDKTCIHEAMEQQTISVAKAGLVCTLNTRCSILAATNPKGKYDESMSLSENTALGTPLLSRFDIILVLLDTYNENWDDMVASYILDGRNMSNENSSSLWSVSKIKSYFMLIRHINPTMTPQAERILRSYYTKQRSLQSRNTSRTTPRLLQSLIRLAEGHARLMLRTKVLIMDAVIAIILVDSSMLGNSILEGLSPLHTVFPDNPTAEYVEKAEKVFQNLNVEINIEENTENFYEETHLINLFHDIATIWISKDTPYLFGSSSSDDSSNSHVFQDRETSASITADKHDSDELEDLYHKPAQISNFSQTPLPISQNVLTETGESTVVSNIQPQKLNDKVSTLSDLRNIFHKDISDTETTVSKSILDLVLETRNEGEGTSTEILQGRANESPMGKNFVNSSYNDAVDVNSDKQQFSNENENPNFENNNIDILEELGISPEKNLQNMHIDPPATSEECIKSLPDKSITINRIFPSKRSLADQLKSFAFSKTRTNHQQNLECRKTLSSLQEDTNKAGTSSVLSTENKSEKLEDNIYCGKRNHSENKKSAFKMIVERYKSSQSNIIEKNYGNYFKTSEASQTSQCSNSLNCIQNDKISNETIENENESANITEKQNHLVAENCSSKKQTADKLKMFKFSKNKASNFKNSDSSTDKE